MEELLVALGFVRYQDVGAEVADKFRAQTGLLLPPDYVEFLAYQQPATMPLLYRFNRGGEDWKGCVEEFHNIAPNSDDLFDLAEQIIQTASGPFLPIGSDPGGNWLCLNLVTGGVYDLDYGSGELSVVAPDFMSFVRELQFSE